MPQEMERQDSLSSQESNPPQRESDELCFLGLGSCNAKSAKIQLGLSRKLSSDPSETGPYEDRPHKYLREQCDFSEATEPFLDRYRQRFAPLRHHNGAQTFFIPVHGITNRSLAGEDNNEIKFFRTVFEVEVPRGAHNLDECTFRRDARKEISEHEYLQEIAEELKGAFDLPAHQGPLCFFTHGAFTGAGISDLDTLRLAMLSGVPTVNVDWRSTQGPWYSLPMRYPIDFNGAITQEKYFEPALDKTFQFIGQNHSAMIGFSRGTAFNAGYMMHRFNNRQIEAPINADVLAHADLAASMFRLRQDGVNPIVAASKNTIVLGNKHDGALRVGRWRIFGDRIGDAEPSDVRAVTEAGGTYVIDTYQRKGGNFNHYVDYKIISSMIRTMVLPK